jgi:hypothetical protein
VQALAVELAPHRLWSYSVEGCESRRQALEQFALFLETVEEIDARRRRTGG